MPWQDHVSNDTVEILEALIQANNKTNYLKRKKYVFLNTMMISTFLLLVYTGFFVKNHSDQNLFNIVTTFLANTYHLLWLVATIALFYCHIIHQKRIEKAKDGLDKMRFEVIDHLKNKWYSSEHFYIRDQISAYMEANGVNVRYRNVPKIESTLFVGKTRQREH